MDFVYKVCGILYYIFHFSAFENNIKTFQNTEFVIPILKIEFEIEYKKVFNKITRFQRFIIK